VVIGVGGDPDRERAPQVIDPDAPACRGPRRALDQTGDPGPHPTPPRAMPNQTIGEHPMAEILDLVDQLIDLFEHGPTLDAILTIAGPGKRHDFSSGTRVRLTTDDAVFNVRIDEDPEYGIWMVSISHLRNPPPLDDLVTRYGPGKQGPYASPGSYPYSWFGLRHPGPDQWVSLGVTMDDEKVGEIVVDR
jgi:hypothetical protein